MVVEGYWADLVEVVFMQGVHGDRALWWSRGIGQIW